MKAETYLSYPGNCEAALKYYEAAIGAKIRFLQKVKGSPMEAELPSEAGGKVLHAVLEIGDTTLMASDDLGPEGAKPMSGFAITLSTATPAENERLFMALAEGGKVTMPLQETFWARSFGMVVDRFGLPWMFNCEKPM